MKVPKWSFNWSRDVESDKNGVDVKRLEKVGIGFRVENSKVCDIVFQTSA